jgi:putative transposase
VNVPPEDVANPKQCLLVFIGAAAEGRKDLIADLIAMIDRVRESKQGWQELLLDLKQRGLSTPQKLTVGDGALRFWAALQQVYPTTKERRCWAQKTANVLNKIPKTFHAKAKSDLHQIRLTETSDTAIKALDYFLEKCGAMYNGACSVLSKDCDVLLAFYDFPTEHCGHLRTMNPIKSTFSTIRLQHRRTKGSGSWKASIAKMFNPAQSASRRCRRLNGHNRSVLFSKENCSTTKSWRTPPDSRSPARNF